MASNPQVLRLLEEMLESGKTPEEVCRDFPELLPEVRQRWQQFQLVDAQVRMLFPSLEASSGDGAATPPESIPAPPAALGYGNDSVRNGPFDHERPARQGLPTSGFGCSQSDGNSEPGSSSVRRWWATGRRQKALKNRAL
jgi:hypothetical protein